MKKIKQEKGGEKARMGFEIILDSEEIAERLIDKFNITKEDIEAYLEDTQSPADIEEELLEILNDRKQELVDEVLNEIDRKFRKK